MATESPARITRVILKNYKSIVHCDVELRPLTILVGPNGSGKSNFLDALRFVSEALTVGLEQAIRNRGNALHILSEARPAGATCLSIELGFLLDDESRGRYAFQIDVSAEGDFRVIREELIHGGVAEPFGPVLFSIDQDDAAMWASDDLAAKYPSSAGDRLFLVAYSGMAEARPVYDLLTSMAFYDPDPASMRKLRPREVGQRLLPDGSNVASILRKVSEADDPELMERITIYLAHIQPGLQKLLAQDLGGYDLLTLRQDIANEPGWWDARPDQISDGTLRALGVLVALFQGRLGGKSETSLVGIEEPEAGLHPGVAGALLDALVDASSTTQVLVTTHSSALLDSDDVDVESLLAVVAEDGVTKIGPVDEVGRSILRDRLFTAGELLQMEQLRPSRQPNERAQHGVAPVTATPG